MMGGANMADDNTVQISIELPDWSPDHPIVAILYHDTKQFGTCNIVPR